MGAARARRPPLTLRLVVDSSAALRAAQSAAAAAQLEAHELLGTPLLWSEVYAAAHAALWRNELTDAEAAELLAAFGNLGIQRRSPRRLYDTAFELATELGLAKTYDAEFLALARIEAAVVLTTDGRLRRGADRTGLVITPAELPTR